MALEDVAFQHRPYQHTPSTYPHTHYPVQTKLTPFDAYDPDRLSIHVTTVQLHLTLSPLLPLAGMPT